MIIQMKINATEIDIENIVEIIKSYNLQVNYSKGDYRTIIGIIGDTSTIDPEIFELENGVEKVVRINKPFKRVSRDLHPEDTILDVNGVKIGGNNFTVMAGPCSVESKEQMLITAEAVKNAGGKILRGGAYKPRTSPYSFQGLEYEGLELLKIAGKSSKLPIITEIISPYHIKKFVEKVDIIQVGTRNMYNFDLLKELGKIKKPVLLKRGMSATIEEWLMSAEYILAGGNNNVILCERGIRTFEKYTRNTLDISAIPIVKKLSHLPIVVDPSHSGGKWWLVEKLSLASMAAGADGLIIEVHNDPAKAKSDGAQSLKPNKFNNLMAKLNEMAKLNGKII